MQTGTPNREPSSPTKAAAPPIDVAAPREEDSGLHDIRSLAQSTKQRISSKRITAPQQTLKDDDVLASSSASWKNLALPQPAKMVSLPEIDELPSKHEIAKQEKAAQKAAKAAKAAPSAAVSASALEASSSGSIEFKPAFSGFAQKAPQSNRSNKGRNLALVGMGLAAAAGITIFVVTQKNNDAAQPVVTAQGAAPASNANAGVSADRMKDLDDATAKLNAQHAAAQAVEATPPPAPPVEPATSAAIGGGDEGKAGNKPVKAVATPKSSSRGASKKPEKVETTSTTEKPEVQTAKSKAGKGGEGQDQDFDALLKEAGVDAKNKDVKPKLDKKSLSTEDFKKGMSAITAKAQACYKGTQGSANVKLTIAPSGSVSKVTISGAFAGKPEGDCVSAAVKGASFPAWDGGPQSFGYPILLSE